MEDRPYSKREQDEYRRDVLNTLNRIETQVIKTNGRVNKLERWQSYVLGFCACLAFLAVPVFLDIVTHWFVK